MMKRGAPSVLAPPVSAGVLSFGGVRSFFSWRYRHSVSTTGRCKYSHVLFTRTNGTDFFDIAPTRTSRVSSVYRTPV